LTASGQLLIVRPYLGQFLSPLSTAEKL